MGDDVVSESELHNALVAVYEAVKTNEREKLLEYLARYKAKLYPDLMNEMVSSRLWALELALQRDRNMEAADILAFYQLKNGDVSDSELSGDIKLSNHREISELVIEAIETCYRNGKQDQLKEYAEILDDKAMGIYMLRIGYQFESLNKFKHFTSIEKEYFKQEPQTSFEFMNLPRDMLELIIATLQGRDVMCLFMTTKQMHKSFDSFSRPEMWRRVLNNTKHVFEGDFVPDDIKKTVLDIEKRRHNWQHGKFDERTLFQFKAAPGPFFELVLDDNWVCALAQHTMKFMNLNTEQLFGVMLSAAPYFETIKQCFVDMRSASPLVAAYCDNGRLYYGRLGVDDISKNVMQVYGCHPYRAYVYAQSNDRVVVSERMQVVDLTTQQIIASNRNIIRHAMANAFNRKMSIGIDSFSSIYLYDENIQQVQQMNTKDGSLIGMIDEFSLAVEVPESGILLYDTRNLASDKYQVLLEKGPVSRQVSLDPRNHRMLAIVSTHNMVAQIDLRTRKWERVWPQSKIEYNSCNSFPLINDRYMLQMSKKGLTAKVTAYDFNVDGKPAGSGAHFGTQKDLFLINQSNEDRTANNY